MRSVAGVALGTSSAFLIIVAVLVNSPALFYMSTALIATLGASRLQAWLSVRGLRLDRTLPPAVRVGETVPVDVTIWSETRLRRPLVMVIDDVPPELAGDAPLSSLPIAPSFDQPISTRYTFAARRRGKYRWESLTVAGTDALGLVTMSRRYASDPAELTVYPRPIPVRLDVAVTLGWGIGDVETGRHSGSGIDPRGIRDYSQGDPLRYVHWASSARTGKLMVKEFDAGMGQSAAFFIQCTEGSEVGTGSRTTLEAMCSHAAWLSEQLLRQGATVTFPAARDPNPKAGWGDSGSFESRETEVYELLAGLRADKSRSISQEILDARDSLQEGSPIYVMLSTQDPDLPDVLKSISHLQRICLIYDPKHYSNEPSSVERSARLATYMEKLRRTGAAVQMMPPVDPLRASG